MIISLAFFHNYTLSSLKVNTTVIEKLMKIIPPVGSTLPCDKPLSFLDLIHLEIK